MVASLYDLYYELEANGIFEFVLPFLLIFTITFAILEKTKILGSEEGRARTNINAVIAFILGLLMITQFEIVQTMNNFLPKVSLFLVIAVMFLILVAIFGAKLDEGFSGILLGIATLVSLVVIYWALGPTLGFEVPWWVEEKWELLLIGFLFLIAIFTVTSKVHDKGKTTKDIFDDFGKTIDKMMGKD